MIPIETKIKGAYLIKTVPHTDDRGCFYTSFNRDAYTRIGIPNFNVAQMNTSNSNKYVLRGLHYQVGFDTQAKLVWVTRGEVLDVFVDLREDSPTFGKWDSIPLVSNGDCLFIPKGCAHGFVSREDETQFNYLCSNNWNKEAERTLIWNDPDLNIDWGITNPIISPKDMVGEFFTTCEKFNDDRS